jgi:nitroreductase
VISLDVFDAIKNRKSIRSYKPERVPQDLLKKLLEAARLAPSAKNLQNWKFVVVDDEETKQRLVKACNNQAFIGSASYVIAGVCDPGLNRWHRVDMGIAMEHIALEAVELGLGTCWIGAFDEEAVKKLLKVPESLQVVTLITIGFPADTPAPRPRKAMEEIVVYNEYR